jgi:TrmH family RNA methyltransferase
LIVIKERTTGEAMALAEAFDNQGITIVTAERHEFDRISSAVTPQGIFAVVDIKDCPEVDSSPFIALDGVSDPGNVGTIIRTAEWFGFQNIILGKECADLFNPKTIRATMGSFLRMRIAETDSLGDFISSHYPDFEVYSAELSAKIPMDSISPKPNKFGLVFGSEAHGVSKETRSAITNKYIITGKGQAESLNVAVSSGIAMNYFSKWIEL